MQCYLVLDIDLQLGGASSERHPHCSLSQRCKLRQRNLLTRRCKARWSSRVASPRLRESFYLSCLLVGRRLEESRIKHSWPGPENDAKWLPKDKSQPNCTLRDQLTLEADNCLNNTSPSNGGLIMFRELPYRWKFMLSMSWCVQCTRVDVFIAAFHDVNRNRYLGYR